MPWRGPRQRPLRRSLSAAIAWSCASAARQTKLSSEPSSAAMRASASSTKSTLERVPAFRAGARSAIERVAGSSIMIALDDQRREHHSGVDIGEVQGAQLADLLADIGERRQHGDTTARFQIET